MIEKTKASESNRITPSSIQDLETMIRTCKRCSLSESRTYAVPGEGPENAKILLLGEAPGKDEDLSGKPFVGRSGKILDQCLAEARIDRSCVFITNVVKCRPPQNRNPNAEETAACGPYLRAQLEMIDPKVVCLLGNVATKAVLGMVGVTSLHGQVFEGRFLVTFHPSAILRNRNLKPAFVSDLLAAKEMADRM